jgi:hypothetical protein
MECQVDANPITYLISWKRKIRNSTTSDDTSDEVLIETILEDSSSSNSSSDSRVRITLEDNRSFLVIQNVTEQDSGLYECVASNGIGSADTAGSRLLVKHKPIIDRSLSLSKSAVESGETGRLFCRAEGAPNVTFSWTKEGQVLKNDDKYLIEPTLQLDIVTYQSTLVINSVSKHDYGSFKCVARNQLGYDSLSINFTRTSKPDCPLSLKVINITSESVTLRWMPGFDGGLPQSFRLRFKTSKEGDPFVYSDVFPSNTTSFTISSLSPSTEYTFHVMAYNFLGESEYTSDNVKAETLKAEVKASTEKVQSQVVLGMTALEIPKVFILNITLVVVGLLMLNVFLVACFWKKRSQNKKRLEEESDQSSTSKNTATMNELSAGGSNGGSNYSHGVTETSLSGSDEENKSDQASSTADYGVDIGHHSSHPGLLSLSSHQTYLIDDNFYPPSVRFSNEDAMTQERSFDHRPHVSFDAGQPDLTMDASFLPNNIMYSSLQRHHHHPRHHHNNRNHHSAHHHHQHQTLNPHLYQQSNLLPPHHHSHQSLNHHLQPKESLHTLSASVQSTEYLHLHHQNEQNQYNQHLQQQQQQLMMNDQHQHQEHEMTSPSTTNGSVPPLPPLRVTPHLNNNNNINAVNNINSSNGVSVNSNFSLPSISEEVFLANQLPVGHLV